MTESQGRGSDESEHLLDLFGSYLDDWEAGGSPDIEEWCRDHPERAQALRRLAREWQHGQRLIDPVVVEGLRPAARLSADMVIGDFRLEKPIGQGGMGQVWVAEQLSLRRLVAVKFIRSERITDRQLELFAREARAGGRLSHPGIVSIYGHGHSEGVAWIAMELVRRAHDVSGEQNRLDPQGLAGARTLRDLKDEVASARELPEGYDRRIARLIAEVAEAMSAAHEAGVIHRDIKPQNVLLTVEDHPKVTDFGLARIVDEPGLSQTGEFAGTYYYMSPEQITARSDGIDHRSDVFSLGVVLYELLALRRPFEGDTSHQVAAQIVTREPSDIRTIRSRVPHDLAVIAGKALEKDRNKRYQTMGALAADLRRHLANEPIQAKPPTRAERAVKWARRNPGKSGATAIASVTFTIIAVLLVENIRTNRALERSADRERRAANIAKQNEQRAVAGEQQARKANEAAERTLHDMEWLLGLQQEVFDGLESRGGGGALEESLDAALQVRYPDLTEFLHGDGGALVAQGKGGIENPLVKATVLQMIAKVFQHRGAYDRAGQLHALALQEFLALYGPSDRRTIVAKGYVASAEFERDNKQYAEVLLREALEASRDALGEDHAETLVLLTHLGMLLVETGRFEEAELCLEETLERLQGKGSEGATAVAARGTLALLRREQGRFGETEKLTRETLPMARRTLGDTNRLTLLLLNNLGEALMNNGRHSEALPFLEEAVPGLRQLMGDAAARTIDAKANLASALGGTGEVERAELVYKEILSTIQPRCAPERLRQVRGNLAQLLKRGERLPEAETLLLELLAEATSGEEALFVHRRLGALYRAWGRLDEAESHCRTARDGLLDLVGPTHPDTLRATSGLCATLLDLDQLDEAEGLLLEAERTIEAVLEPSDEYLAVLRMIREKCLRLYEERNARAPEAGLDARVNEYRSKLSD